jgi:uncharacterized repeat protein (TIGR01451 family)
MITNNLGNVSQRVVALLLTIFISIAFIGGFLFTLDTSTNVVLANEHGMPTPTPIPDPANDAFLQSVQVQSAQESYTSPGVETNDHIITHTVVFSIAQGSDDAGIDGSSGGCSESIGENEIYIGWCDFGTSPITSGLRFESVWLPEYAGLADAYLEVTVEGGYTRDIPETRIYGEASSNSTTFSLSDMPSHRTEERTANFALWNTAEHWDGTAGVYRSPSLLTVTQEVMAISGWEAGNPLTFILTPDSHMTPGNRNVFEHDTVHHRFRAWNFQINMEPGLVPAHLIVVYTQTRKTDTGLSTLLAEPVTAIGNGIDYVTITVTLSDTYGTLIDKNVSLSANEPITITWPEGNTTDSNGRVQAHVSSALPQIATIYAHVIDDDVTVEQTAVVTFTDVPVEGLTAINDSPTLLGNSTALTATITAGTNVNYVWDLDNGQSGSGSQVSHTYLGAGSYTAVVTASNESSVVTATTPVTIISHPDLAVGKTGPATAAAGSLVVYDITVANQGGMPATSILVTDTLPLSTTFVAETSSYPYTVDTNTGMVTWHIDFLAPDTQAEFTLQARLDAELQVDSVITTPYLGIWPRQI